MSTRTRQLSSAERDPLCEWLRRLFNSKEFSDITFVVGADEQELHAHRIVLAARCPYLRGMLEGKWRGRRVVRLPNARIDGRAFSALVRYLYTARLELPYELGRACARLCKQCELPRLRARVLVTAPSASPLPS